MMPIIMVLENYYAATYISKIIFEIKQNDQRYI